MVVDYVPAVVRNIANDSKDLCCNGFNYSDFMTLLCGIFFGLDSFSAIVRTFVFSSSLSQLSRAATSIPSEALLKRNRNRIAKLIAQTPNAKQRFCLANDDTLVRKFGRCPENFYWFDHCLGSTYRGRNYLVMAVLDTYTGQAFPVTVALLHGVKSEKYKPRLEVVKEQLLILKTAGLGILPFTADSWFADKNFFQWLEEQKFDFEIEVKSNRKVTYLNKKQQGNIAENKRIVYPSISDVACSLKRNTAYSGGAPKQIAGGVARLYGSSQRIKFAAVWNIEDKPSDKPFAIYATNNTSRCLSRIWALSRFRWGIEVHFRQSKQEFAFDKYPVHDAKVAFNLIVLGMFLISSLELARFDKDAAPMEKKLRRKKYEFLSLFIQRIREEAFTKTIRRAFVMPSKREKIIDHFEGRLNPLYTCKKPRDKIKQNKSDVYEESLV